jgi:hypothetical protein
MSYVAEFTASWQLRWKALVMDQISMDTKPLNAVFTCV